MHAAAVQAPEAQLAPNAQARPHRPQLETLVERSAHAGPHATAGAAQTAAHVPLVHAAPDGHALPQVPQWAALLPRLKHSSPHAEVPLAQPQLPATQVCVAEHAAPHAPQCSALVCSATQASPHRTRPAGQAEGDGLPLLFPQPASTTISSAAQTDLAMTASCGGDAPMVARAAPELRSGRTRVPRGS